MSLERIKTYLTKSNLIKMLCALYLLSIILGLFYLIIPVYNLSWDILGIVYLVTLTISFPVLYKLSNRLNKTSGIGFRINSLIILYYLLVYLGMYTMMGGNIFPLFSYSIGYMENITASVMVWFGYFGPLVLGLVIIVLLIKNISSADLFSENIQERSESLSLFKKIIVFLLRLLSVANFVFVAVVGTYCAWVITSQSAGGYSVGVTGMYIPEVSLFLAFIGFATICLFLKAFNARKYRKIMYPIALFALIISCICLLPFAATPIAIHDAEIDFAGAFGSDWEDRIPNDVKRDYFLQQPYSIPQYFLGYPPMGCKVEVNTMYFNGTQSSYDQDKNIVLRFDAYMPLNNGLDSVGKSLPGRNSTLIRIHGGGWSTGDKGFTGMIKMNRYFAAQGYVVFDIQYGLNNSRMNTDSDAPRSVKGNFSIDDMVRHIGNFTHYLAKNAGKYGANLSSTFISGFSAGGHLACVAGCAMKNGSYTDILNDTLKIKGIIPFYPGNIFKEVSWFLGRNEFLDPELLIDNESPPSLVYQGMEDALVPWQVSKSWQDAYRNAKGTGSHECSVIYFPFTGHANDMYFNGHLNLVFLYYMERFIYIYR